MNEILLLCEMTELLDELEGVYAKVKINYDPISLEKTGFLLNNNVHIVDITLDNYVENTYGKTRKNDFKKELLNSLFSRNGYILKELMLYPEFSPFNDVQDVVKYKSLNFT